MLTTSSENHVKSLSENNHEPEWLLNQRLSSYSLFKQLAMPSFIYGLNINLNLNLNLSDLDVSNPSIIQKEIINNNINVKIYSLNDLTNINDPLLIDIFKEKFMNLVKPNEKFTAFHNAFVNNILLIHIPKDTKVDEPIEIISKLNNLVNFDHLIVVAESGSEVTIVEDFISDENAISDENSSSDENLNSETQQSKYLSKIVEIYASPNSIVNYGSLQILDKNTINFVKKLASTNNNAKVNWLDCCFGSQTTLSEVTTFLNGEGSETHNHGIFFGNENQQFDLVAKSIHNFPNTNSDIFTKGALTDSSKCVYRGLVKIHRIASGSNGYQKEDTLLLSPNAAADSIPDLEIDNSNVKCSHGASIGRIDNEKLFYLRSRGFSEKQAIKTYVKGFLNDLISKMEIRKLRENMNKIIDERMKD